MECIESLIQQLVDYKLDRFNLNIINDSFIKIFNVYNAKNSLGIDSLVCHLNLTGWNAYFQKDAVDSNPMKSATYVVRSLLTAIALDGGNFEF